MKQLPSLVQDKRWHAALLMWMVRGFAASAVRKAFGFPTRAS